MTDASRWHRDDTPAGNFDYNARSEPTTGPAVRASRRCTAATKAGRPCRQNAVHGDDRCASHLGLAKRRSKLTADRMARIVDAITLGSFQETAARAAGISPATFYSWMERGEHDLVERHDSPFAVFVEAVRDARALSELSAIEAIQRASGTDWRAAAWLLERRLPARWGRNANTPEHDTATDVKRAAGEVVVDATGKRRDQILSVLRGALEGMHPSTFPSQAERP